MPREVDKRKTAKALRRLKRAALRAEAGEGAAALNASPLTDWEKEFVAGVTERLEAYGSAFRDPTKGRLEEALSEKQTRITRAIEKKTQPKRRAAPGADPAKPDPPRRSSFKRKAPVPRGRSRDINEDAPEPAPPPPPRPPRARPSLRLIEGGRRPRTRGGNSGGEPGGEGGA